VLKLEESLEIKQREGARGKGKLRRDGGTY